jgi:hypothetical protein
MSALITGSDQFDGAKVTLRYWRRRPTVCDWPAVCRFLHESCTGTAGPGAAGRAFRRSHDLGRGSAWLPWSIRYWVACQMPREVNPWRDVLSDLVRDYGAGPLWKLANQLSPDEAAEMHYQGSIEDALRRSYVRGAELHKRVSA